jgi:RimJ/RimL family protein N-acetyltransferase
VSALESGHLWPLFDLRLRTPRLELRVPTDDDLEELCGIARRGLHDPNEIVFTDPSWEELPSPEFELSFLQYSWGLRARFSPEDWRLSLAAIAGGRPIGVQDFWAQDFSHRRSVSTGSWIGKQFQRRGLGTEMRAAVLWLAFECLGALVAESAYLDGNAASARVSEKLGYVANGERIVAPKGEPMTQHLVRVTPETWHRELVPVEVEGLEPCLDMLGATRR